MGGRWREEGGEAGRKGELSGEKGRKRKKRGIKRDEKSEREWRHIGAGGGRCPETDSSGAQAPAPPAGPLGSSQADRAARGAPRFTPSRLLSPAPTAESRRCPLPKRLLGGLAGPRASRREGQRARRHPDLIRSPLSGWDFPTRNLPPGRCSEALQGRGAPLGGGAGRALPGPPPLRPRE